MKICVVLREYPPNLSGGGVHALELVQALVRLGHDLTIVAPQDGGALYKQNEIDDGRTADNLHDADLEAILHDVAVHLIPIHSGRGFADLLSAILDLHARGSVDVVHIHFVHPLAILGALIKENGGPPVILSGHGGDIFILTQATALDLSALSRPNSAYNHAVLAGLRAADRILTVSQQLQEICSQELGLDPMRVRYTPHGVDHARFDYHLPGSEVRRRHGIGEQEKVVLFTGRLSREKGVRYLVQAMPDVLTQEPNTRALVVGDGPERQGLAELVAHLGLGDRVVFSGAVPYNRVPGYRAASDLLVLPSLSEGTPVSIFETFAMKRAVVASAVGGIPEVVEDGVTGKLVSPRQSSALAKALVHVLGSPDERLLMGENGYAYVRELSWENVAQRILEVYEETLS